MVLPELCAYLVAQGFGSTVANPPTIQYGVLMPTPDVVICLQEYGGLPDEPDNVGGIRLEYPFVQALVRGVKDDQDGPRLVIQQVRTAFVKVVNQTLSGIPYKAIEPVSPPFKLRQDDSFRWEFVCNFKVTKGYSAS